MNTSPGPAATSLDELIQAAMAASADQKAAALRVLRGQARTVDDQSTMVVVEQYLTLREVAKKLGLSPCTLWRWRIPGCELGGRRRFRMSDVRAYLDGDDFKRRTAALRAQRLAAKEQ